MNTHPPLIIFPAIDLRHGQVVRLKEGDPQKQTWYSGDPAQIAELWLSAGATWLHVVNLDGAFEQPDSANRRALQAILQVANRFNAHVQFGGGLRDLKAVAEAISIGVNRVVLGTLAVEQPMLVAEAIHRFGPSRVAVGLDARDGRVRTRGWQQSTDQSAHDLALAFRHLGLNWLIYTDIARDGMQTGLNLSATIDLARIYGLQVIASGGVNNLDDIEGARRAGLAGVIIGRALYEGTLKPEQLFPSSK